MIYNCCWLQLLHRQLLLISAVKQATGVVYDKQTKLANRFWPFWRKFKKAFWKFFVLHENSLDGCFGEKDKNLFLAICIFLKSEY